MNPEPLAWPAAGLDLVPDGDAVRAGSVRLPVDTQVCGLALAGDLALVADLTAVTAYDPALRVVWRTVVAVDGVLIQDVEGDRVYVEAERDPPGGWVSVVLDVRDGRVLAEG